MQELTSDILRILKGDIWKAFESSGERILHAIQVKTASYMRKTRDGALPVPDKLSSRSGFTLKDLQSTSNTIKKVSDIQILVEKSLTANGAHLLTDQMFPISPKQRKLFKWFSVMAGRENKRARDYWFRMAVFANRLKGRGHLEDAINSVADGSSIERILRSEITKMFPNKQRVIKI